MLPVSGGAFPPRRHIVYLSHAFVDVKVQLPAHIKTNPVPVSGLVVHVDEGDLDGVGALRVEGHPVRAAVLGVSEELVDAFPGGKLSFNFVRLLPSSLRCHLGSWRSSLSKDPDVAHCACVGSLKPGSHAYKV